MRGEVMKPLLMILLFMFSIESLAQSSKYQRQEKKQPAAKSTKAKGKKEDKKSKSEKLDISGLEEKYWAPKDTDFTVVQNRTFTKDKKIGVSLLAGPVINDNFSEGIDLSLTANYFFSERHGVEFTYIHSDMSDNQTTEAFKTTIASGSGITPDHSKTTSYIGLGYNFVPIYAKVSFLDRKILYFDMAITPTIGVVSYDQQLKPDKGGTKSKTAITLGLDITQYLFLNKYLALRADIRNRWYKEELLNYREGTKIKDQTTQATIFLVGATLFFD